MKKRVLSFFLMVHCTIVLFGQDSIRYRVVLIGDAGEINDDQKAIITNAANIIIPNKTSVMYLGDNIYPRGMALPGNKKEEATKQILQSEYMPFRSKNVPVYFVPGNHDWDKMGPKGLAKIKQQWAFLDSQHDSLLQLVPPNGCPDPVAIQLSDSLTVIAFDSEWWLYPFNKSNPDADCSCKTKIDVLGKMEQLLYENRYKVILLASHHPFQSYGTHGGYYSLVNNIFPFTALSPHLYIPLPVIGSLYPLLRKAFTSPEDLRHPLYQEMIRLVDHVFAGFPNMIHVAGHEHGLQFIKNDQTQVVSGAGAKESYVRADKALFGKVEPGFVTADLLTGNNMRFTFYTYTKGQLRVTYTYLQVYTNKKIQEEQAMAAITADSVLSVAYKGFDNANKLKRTFFGENYRKEWGAETKFPVIRISDIKGGLTPVRRGGGHQTYSLRLKDSSDNEWILRSVEKYPDVLLPPGLRETFAKDILVDAMSAQHPYAALAVPPIANAVHVPYSHPIIGVVAPDKRLGIYEKIFAGTICLLEEREPLGKSDNTPKMLREMNEDNDNSFDSTSFLRARLLDIFLGDWDRHADQWRYAGKKEGKGKRYIAVPRDRDQVFYINEGFFPNIVSAFVARFLKGFNEKIKDPAYFFFSSTDLNQRFLNQFTYEEWMRVTNEFVATVTDSVLEKALQAMPKSSYDLKHDELLRKLKARRNDLPRAMSAYYYFINKIVDIQITDKNEFVEIRDTLNGGMKISIYKLSKKGEIKDQIFSRVFFPAVTKEIRLFTRMGDDSVLIDNKTVPIKLRIVGGDGNKKYDIVDSRKKVLVYEKETNANFLGNTSRVRKYLSNDSSNVEVVPSNIFNTVFPLVTAGYNIDDGFLFGAGIRYTHQGFRKRPYASVQQFTVGHSFSTSAFKVKYKGEWVKAIGNADFVIDASALGPENTQNFFGTGNQTPFNKTGNYKRYYRTRFNLYSVEPVLRWHNRRVMNISIGPSFQYYKLDSADNAGRFITNTSYIHSYDSVTTAKDKAHLGLVIDYTVDKRNSRLLPTWGYTININMRAYAGVNAYSKSFSQITSEVSLYKPVDNRSNIIIADRLGGGMIFGNAAFYQSLFLGGQENLLGYRQYRFAGQYMMYNNVEFRMKLADFANYILPGQLGLLGFYDLGRVWEMNDHSNQWHNGVGGGFYFAPAQMAVLRITAGYGGEGWYPYVAFGLRF
ncbi:MAG: BamA/TamA family outer membrane protein [Bacteroidetes bacterium]|nr:BamA/TamA family outer membrane protein [Bacteroidota bacterium]